MQQPTLYSAPSSPHVGRIEFARGRQDATRGSFQCTGTFAIDGEEWSVELEVIDPYRADMLGFFEELAAGTAGWLGVKAWESEFAEMALAARNSGDGVAVF